MYQRDRASSDETLVSHPDVTAADVDSAERALLRAYRAGEPQHRINELGARALQLRIALAIRDSE